MAANLIFSNEIFLHQLLVKWLLIVFNFKTAWKQETIPESNCIFLCKRQTINSVNQYFQLTETKWTSASEKVKEKGGSHLPFLGVEDWHWLLSAEVAL